MRVPLRRISTPVARQTGAPKPWVAGICSGLSLHTAIDVRLLRVIIAAVSLAGLGLLIYLWLWIAVPSENPYTTGESLRRKESGALARTLAEKQVEQADETAPRRFLIGAGILVLVAAAALALGLTHVRSLPSWSWSVLLIGTGALLIWTRKDLGESTARRTYLAIGAGIVLVAIGMVHLVGRGTYASLFNSVLVSCAVLVGVGAVLAPVWVRLTRELGASRAEQIREATRADIAAHLHDSVLQTLALIRARAEEPTSVRTLARRQERELRTWLYEGEGSQYDSLVALVGAKIAQVEDRYGVPIEYVHVADMAPGVMTHNAGAIVQEACQNAAVHGKPPISVYMECSGSQVEVWVKDRGAGFDVEKIPQDRHGVRDSILGRAKRLGGKATITSGSAGTEIYLFLEDE